jgi:hypothetical protein
MFNYLSKTERLTAQVVQPVKPVPPHCPYFVAVHPVVDPLEVLVLFVLDEVPLDVVVAFDVGVTLVGPLDAILVATAEPEYGGPVVVTVSIPEQVAPADLVVPPE